MAGTRAKRLQRVWETAVDGAGSRIYILSSRWKGGVSRQRESGTKGDGRMIRGGREKSCSTRVPLIAFISKRGQCRGPLSSHVIKTKNSDTDSAEPRLDANSLIWTPRIAFSTGCSFPFSFSRCSFFRNVANYAPVFRSPSTLNRENTFLWLKRSHSPGAFHRNYPAEIREYTRE